MVALRRYEPDPNEKLCTEDDEEEETTELKSLPDGTTV